MNSTSSITAFDQYAQVRRTAAGRYLIENPRVTNGSTIYPIAAMTHDTLEDALIDLDRARQIHTTQRAIEAQESQRADQFLAAHPDLYRRQLAWQVWRSEEYDRRIREARNLQRELIHRQGFPSSRAADGKTGRVAKLALEAEKAVEEYQTTLTAADTATKRAIASQDADAWAMALDHCEQCQQR